MSIANEFNKLLKDGESPVLKENAEQVNEVFTTSKSRNAMEVIEELTNIVWSKGKKSQREACKRFNELANSDEVLSNKFLKEVDKATTTIGENLLKKCKKSDNIEEYELYDNKKGLNKFFDV